MADIAREGTVWWCTHCGRIAADKEGRMAALGWSKECTQNAVLVLEDTMKLDESGRVIQAEMVDKSGESKFSGKVGEGPEWDSRGKVNPGRTEGVSAGCIQGGGAGRNSDLPAQELTGHGTTTARRAQLP